MAPRPSTGEYPTEWEKIAVQVKADAGWHCIRCKHPHSTEEGYMLTVHHLDLNKSNCAWWNLAALCQRCHLRIQGKVELTQFWMFDFSDWIKPYVAGYYAAQQGKPDDKEYVMAHLEELLRYGKELQHG
jgi:hypothetical protein